MVGIFEVETIESKWVPPFDKKNSSNIYYVKEGELFDVDPHIKEDVFMLDNLAGDVAVIKHDQRYIIKKGIFAANLDVLGAQTLKLHIGKPVELSFMWGDFGITKKITYQGMSAEKKVEKKEDFAENSEDFNSEEFA